MSIIVLGLIVNTSSFSEVAFAENPDKEAAKEARDSAKDAREQDRKAAKEAREDIKEFSEGTVVTSSSSSPTTELDPTSTTKVTICHVPPGNPGNAHTITVGSPAAIAHLANHSGDIDGPCGEVFEGLDHKAEKELRLAEGSAQKESKALERAEMLIQKLEQQVASLEKRLLQLLEKYESGEYYGNISTADVVTNSYVISFEGIALSIYDDSVTTEMTGELFMENQVTTPNTSKFKIVSGEVIVGNDIYDVAFGKARLSSSGPSGEEYSLVIVLQTIDSEENDNTIKITLGFNAPLEGEFGSPSEEFEILDNSKVSGQWALEGNGQLSLGS